MYPPLFPPNAQPGELARALFDEIEKETMLRNSYRQPVHREDEDEEEEMQEDGLVEEQDTQGHQIRMLKTVDMQKLLTNSSSHSMIKQCRLPLTK